MKPELSTVWIEDGILYHQYHQELSLPIVLEAERKSLALLTEQALPMVPVIVFLEAVEKGKYSLTMADYAKVLVTFDISRYTSGIWIVGVVDEVKEAILKIGSYFLVNRIFFAQDLKEAKEAARLFTASSLSVLDPE